MNYVSGVLFGLAGAVIAVVLWVVVAFVLPIALPMLISRFSGQGGAGVSAASLGSGSVMLAALIGFALGAYWGLRR